MGDLSVQDIVRFTSIACGFATRRWDSVMLKALKTSTSSIQRMSWTCQDVNTIYVTDSGWHPLCLSVQKANCTGSWYSVLSDFAYYVMLADGLVVFKGFPID